MNKINICFTIDDQYAPHCRATIASILAHAKNNDSYFFYIISGKLSFLNKLKFYLLRKIRKFRIVFISIDEDTLRGAYIPEGTHFSVVNYFRLFLPDLLLNVDKVIYLDSDVIVVKDISGLWKINLGDYMLGAAKSMNSDINSCRLGRSKKSNYINSGVLILNLKLMRRFGTNKLFLDFFKTNKIPLLNVDQDLINIVLNKKIKLIPQNWNAEVRTDIDIYSGYIKIIENPYIIHYLTSDKPWNKNSNQRYIGEYKKYRKMSNFI